MSRKSHFIGGLLCLAGGYLLGYSSGTQDLLKSVLGGLNSIVNALPFIPGLVDQLSVQEWYLSLGSVLIVIGVILVVLGGSGGPRETKESKKAAKEAQAPQVPVRPPGTCKFCGADMKGSKTYCPNCGRSQT